MKMLRAAFASMKHLRWQSDDTAEHNLGSQGLDIQRKTELCEKLMLTTVANSRTINVCSEI